MGVKDLWTILTPYAERKPICELRGQIVAIDLAGWVCESLNVVDYFVHPRHHLKNLFFRTCYLIWEEVTPIFILEGLAPGLKRQVIDKRNEIQFRGVRPKMVQSQRDSQKPNSDKTRTRFNYVLKQCETLLHAMGIQCLQGPGEAEAYCAFLNLKGLVDGVISQDSDCFAYGALRVYRNFSVSSQGALAAKGGAVDIYDVNNICLKMDFGQNKAIVMALLCGCDYCPEGIGGVGRDSVVKLFNNYKNYEILERIRSWRHLDNKFSTLEMRVDDKSICSNCGHIGRTLSHTKNGCGVCRTSHGCDERLWKEERLSLKAELTLRKKALAESTFPSEEIITEFLKQPKEIPKLQLHWRQPDMLKFIKEVGYLLQWPEIYSFQKFFPILTRWHVLNANRLKDLPSAVIYITPKEIVKKRTVKGIPSLELLWQDVNGFFNGIIPESQLKEFLNNNPKGLQDIWSTVEPLDKVRSAYPSIFELFLKSKEKPKKIPKKTAKSALKSSENSLGSLENFSDLIQAANEIDISMKPKRKLKTKKRCSRKGMQMIDRFFKPTIEKSEKQTDMNCAYEYRNEAKQCSTPMTKNIPSDLESDIDENIFDVSNIVNDIISNSHESFILTSHKGKKLCYEKITQNISVLLDKSKDFANNTDRSIDDFHITSEKRSLLNSFYTSAHNEKKRISLDDSFDVLVKMGGCNKVKCRESTDTDRFTNLVDRFKRKQLFSLNMSNKYSEEKDEKNVSYFFNNSFQLENNDVFETVMETSMGKQPNEVGSDVES